MVDIRSHVAEVVGHGAPRPPLWFRDRAGLDSRVRWVTVNGVRGCGVIQHAACALSTTVRLYKCNIISCNWVGSAYDLTLHQHNSHSKGCFKCATPNCGKEFRDSAGLRQHSKCKGHAYTWQHTQFYAEHAADYLNIDDDTVSTADTERRVRRRRSGRELPYSLEEMLDPARPTSEYLHQQTRETLQEVYAACQEWRARCRRLEADLAVIARHNPSLHLPEQFFDEDTDMPEEDILEGGEWRRAWTHPPQMPGRINVPVDVGSHPNVVRPTGDRSGPEGEGAPALHPLFFEVPLENL